MTKGVRSPYVLQSRHKGLQMCPHCHQKFNRHMIGIHMPTCKPTIVPHTYPELQAWNLYLAGPQNWMVQTAVAENAPPDAIYRGADIGKGDRGWQRMSALPMDHPFREFFKILIEKGVVK